MERALHICGGALSTANKCKVADPSGLLLQNQGVQPRPVNKDLIIENYRFNVPGFTGTRK